MINKTGNVQIQSILQLRKLHKNIYICKRCSPGLDDVTLKAEPSLHFAQTHFEYT